MAFATGSAHGVRYVKETTFGVTPSTPTMTKLRHTSGFALKLSRTNIVSEELRDDAQISSIKLGNKSIEGPMPMELSYGEYDPFLESLVRGTWTADVLKAGTNLDSYTIEDAQTDIDQYQVFNGCMVNSLSLDVAPDAIVTGSFGFIGKDSDPFSTTPLDPSPVASQTALPFDSFSGVLKEGGATIGIVTAFNLNVDNGIAPNFVVGSNSSAQNTPERINVTGSIDVFFEDATLINKFINETQSSLELTLGNGVSESYVISLPNLTYIDADNSVADAGTRPISMPFQCVYDVSEATNIKFTRIP